MSEVTENTVAPLSAEEEADVRGWLDGKPAANREVYGLSAVHTIRRLLATLDAARRASDAQVAGIEQVAVKLEAFGMARMKDHRANRDAPDNINEIVAKLCATWADMLRAALAAAPQLAPYDRVMSGISFRRPRAAPQPAYDALLLLGHHEAEIVRLTGWLDYIARQCDGHAEHSASRALQGDPVPAATPAPQPATPPLDPTAEPREAER